MMVMFAATSKQHGLQSDLCPGTLLLGCCTMDNVHQRFNVSCLQYSAVCVLKQDVSLALDEDAASLLHELLCIFWSKSGPCRDSGNLILGSKITQDTGVSRRTKNLVESNDAHSWKER